MHNDFTKPTSYGFVFYGWQCCFVCGSRGVNAILQGPEFQLVVLCSEVVPVDSHLLRGSTNRVVVLTVN